MLKSAIHETGHIAPVPHSNRALSKTQPRSPNSSLPVIAGNVRYRTSSTPKTEEQHLCACTYSFHSRHPLLKDSLSSSNGLKRKAAPSRSTSPSSGWPPLGRGSDGRFGLRRFRAKLTPTPFGTHRAFTHALPPSFGLRSVPFTVPSCFFPLPLK